MNRILLLGIGAGLWLMAGCGGPPQSSVSGKVTAAGQPVTSAMINFINPKSGAAASGDLDASGGYSIAKVAPGKYKVFVVPKSPSAADQAPKPDRAPVAAPASNVPQKYQDDATSGLDAEIKPGANANVDFKLD